MKKRNTKQKEIINKEIMRFKTFFTAEDLYNKIKIIDKQIGLATVYRVLKDLRKNKKIYSYTCNGKVIY
jgi:Fe2+ or Zn2+ uptake regulation protein